MDLSIIIVNWKSVGYLRKCLSSIMLQTQGLNYEVVVVDNASDDRCGEMLAREFPHVRFVQRDSNSGFAKANNCGARIAAGNVLCFLNPDTEVLRDALKTMHNVVQNSNGAGAVGCRLLNGDGSLQTSCIQAFPTVVNQFLDSEWLQRVWPRSALWGIAPLFDDSPQPRSVQVISGACLMISRSVFESIGRFSEEYFMYAEDVDLCYKTSLQGLTNYYVPAASIIHYGGGSSSQAGRAFSGVQMRESIRCFLEKYRGAAYAARYRTFMAWSARVRIGLLRVTGSRKTSSVEKWVSILRWAKEATE